MSGIPKEPFDDLFRHANDPSRGTPFSGRPMPPQLRYRRLSDIPARAVRWAWQQRLAYGEFTLVAGDAGVGKGFLMSYIMAQFTTGEPWPEDERPREPRDVLLLSAEENAASTIRPRLQAIGGNPARVIIPDTVLSPEAADLSQDHADKEAPGGVLGDLLDVTYNTIKTNYFTKEQELDDLGVRIRLLLENEAKAPGVPLNLARHMPQIAELVLEARPALVVVDPLKAYLDGVDVSSSIGVRTAMRPLLRLAEVAGFVLIGVLHLNKGGSNKAIYRVADSQAFIQCARTAFAIGIDYADQARRRRLVLNMKSNLDEPALGMAYEITTKFVLDDQGQETIKSARLDWVELGIETTADELFRDPGVEPGTDPTMVGEAKAWLEARLAERFQPASLLFSDAAAHGISKPALVRAKRELGVTVRKLSLQEAENIGWKSRKEDGFDSTPWAWFAAKKPRVLGALRCWFGECGDPVVGFSQDGVPCCDGHRLGDLDPLD